VRLEAGNPAGGPLIFMTDRRVRYRVLALTFMTAMIMYIDRVCIGTAAPAIREEFGFDKITMGFIFSAFSLGYTMFQIPGGWAVDRFGPRKILTISMVWWSATWQRYSTGQLRFCWRQPCASAQR
jgi:sugar phosphate permease